MNKKFYKSGIKFGLVILFIFTITAFINLNSHEYICYGGGIARMADWLYPIKYWLTNYATCMFSITDVVIAGAIWFVIGFCFGSILVIFKKNN